MSMLLELVFIVFLSFVQPLCFPNIKKVECSFSRTLCSVNVCNYTIIDQFSVGVNQIGCTFTKPHNSLKLRLRHEIKIGAGKFKPGIYDYTIDFCDTSITANPMVNLFLKKEMVAMWVCEGPAMPMYVHNVSMDVKKIPSLGQSGDYRMSFTMISGKYHEIISVAAYGKRCVSV